MQVRLVALDGEQIVGAATEEIIGEGALTFDSGETAKTVSVTVLNDAHDEGEEPLTLRLSEASGAVIADRAATGTIENSDPIPQAWLARFGRTVAGHVTDAVAERLAGPAGGGSRVTLGGDNANSARTSWTAGPGGPVTLRRRCGRPCARRRRDHLHAGGGCDVVALARRRGARAQHRRGRLPRPCGEGRPPGPRLGHRAMHRPACGCGNV